MRTIHQLHGGGKGTIPVPIREEPELEDGDLVGIDLKRIDGATPRDVSEKSKSDE